MQQIIVLVVIAGAFYFLLIRPQQQQAKKQAQTVASLTPGTHIVTIGGIYATVVSVEDDRVRVAVADGSELELAKRAVAAVIPDAEADHEDEADEDDSVADEPMLADSDSDSNEPESETDAPSPDSGFAPSDAAAHHETRADA